MIALLHIMNRFIHKLQSIKIDQACNEYISFKQIACIMLLLMQTRQSRWIAW